MEQNEYRIKLRKVLDENSLSAVRNLNVTIQSLPEKTKSIEIVIFPDQDGEGTFGVQVSLSGPDLHVLNKTIEDSANLINVIHTPNGLKPNVPLMDSFDSSFEVNDVLCDVVADWLTLIWKKSDNKTIDLPVTIIGDDGYGTNLPIKLR